MNGYTVVWRKSNRHKWNLICSNAVDPLHRDVLVVNELEKFSKIDNANEWQVGYFPAMQDYGSSRPDTYSQKTKMDLQLTPSETLPEPLKTVRQMMIDRRNYADARRELIESGYDYSTEFALENTI